MMPMENTHQNNKNQRPACRQWSFENHSFQRVLNVGYHPLPFLAIKNPWEVVE